MSRHRRTDIERRLNERQHVSMRDNMSSVWDNWSGEDLQLAGVTATPSSQVRPVKRLTTVSSCASSPAFLYFSLALISILSFFIFQFITLLEEQKERCMFLGNVVRTPEENEQGNKGEKERIGKFKDASWLCFCYYRKEMKRNSNCILNVSIALLIPWW